MQAIGGGIRDPRHIHTSLAVPCVMSQALGCIPQELAAFGCISQCKVMAEGAILQDVLINAAGEG